VQAWRRQAFFALSNSTQMLLEPQRSVLPGAPITAPAGASNCRFQDDSRIALPLSRTSAQRVYACYEWMDAAYCSTVIREESRAGGRVPLIEHNRRGGQKKKFAPHEARRYKTRSGAERCNARLKDGFGARPVEILHVPLMCQIA
jgi:hypothetical protein